jgi:hypothetical protein
MVWPTLVRFPKYVLFSWCHGSGGWSPASHRGGPGSRSYQSMWDFWCIKWHWDRFFSRVLRLSFVSIIPPWLSTVIPYLRHVGGRSSETLSHPIDKNNNSSSKMCWLEFEPEGCRTFEAHCHLGLPLRCFVSVNFKVVLGILLARLSFALSEGFPPVF